MVYSVNGIANLACGRIGVGAFIWDDGSVTDQRVQRVYEYVRDIVLEAKGWKFSTRRFELAQVDDPLPEYGWDYAYGLPSDFLKLASPDKDDSIISPETYPWRIETLSDGNLYFLCDYDNTDNDGLYIRCVVRIADPTKFSPSFVDALAWRLAAELSTTATESSSKFKWCMDNYELSLMKAEGINRSLDHLVDETGSTLWEDAGR